MEEYLFENFLLMGRISRRAYKSCKTNGISNLDDLKAYYERFRDFRKMRNCGVKTDFELRELIEKYSFSGLEVEKKPLHTSQSALDSEILKKILLFHEIIGTHEVPGEVLNTQSFIRIADFLMNGEVIFKGNQQKVLNKVLKVRIDQSHATLVEMADELYFSKERIRQVRNEILEKLPEKLLVLQHFSDDLQQNYGLDLEQDIIWIDEEKAHRINSFAGTSLTPEFLTFLFGIYLNEKFQIIGLSTDVLLWSPCRKRHSWSRFYLVRNEIAAGVDFDNLVQDIYKTLSLNKTTTYISDFASCIKSFIKPLSMISFSDILPVTEMIIFSEFECYPGSEGELIFPKSRKISLWEYPYEALEHLKIPSRIEVICEKIKELHPELNPKIANVRWAMKSEAFARNGRTGIYGLKKWIKEGDLYKEGTIREIVEEYLAKSLEPRHISEIVQEVLKYRPNSHKHSIIVNLINYNKIKALGKGFWATTGNQF